MKKIISLLLAVLIATGIFALDTGVAAATKIKSVKILSVKKPVDGETPDYSGIKIETYNSKSAEITEVYWTDADGRVENDSTFSEGKEYSICFVITPKDGYVFAFDGEAYTGEVSVPYFNLGQVKASEEAPGALYIECKPEKATQPKEKTAIENLYVGIPKPIVGKTPDDIKKDIEIKTEVDGDITDIYDYCWTEWAGKELRSFDKFEKDKKYYLIIQIKLYEYDYYFPHTENIYRKYLGTLQIPGYEVDVCNIRADESIIFIDIKSVLSVEPVEQVNISGCQKPVAGEKPDLSDIEVKTNPESYAKIAEAHWIDSDGNILTADDTFVGGEKYALSFTINPKSGFYFEFEDSKYTGEATISDFAVNCATELPKEWGVLSICSEYVLCDLPPVESTEETTAEQTESTTEQTEPTTQQTEPSTEESTSATEIPPIETEPIELPVSANFNKVENNILKGDTDTKDVKGSKFTDLKLKAVKSDKKSVTITWKKCKGAKGYLVYGAKCGKKCKLIKTVSSKNDRLTLKKLKKGCYYKYMVVAYKVKKGKKDIVSVSKTVHRTTTGGKNGNPIKLTLNKTKKTLKKNKGFTLKTKVKWDKKKYQKHVKTVRFESSNPKIAKVNSKGKITPLKKGSCYVYAYAQTGLYKRIKITIK